MSFITTNELTAPTASRLKMSQYYRQDETTVVNTLIQAAQLDEAHVINIANRARLYVKAVRKAEQKKGGIDGLMVEYDLSSEEGIALMCLAESLLRIPDKTTVDKLIKDKISEADWRSHVGKSHSSFVNAATWGLLLTGKVLSQDESAPQKFSNVFKKMITKSGEPVIRQALKQSMKVLGRQFVLGETIVEAINRTHDYHQSYCYSFDMLGEAAKTDEDAQRYFKAYQDAIDELAKQQADSPITSNGISVKLSALHSRYEIAHRDKVFAELLPRLEKLLLMSAKANINFTIDAEEAARLDLSIDLIEQVLTMPELADWQGFGLAVQAYQKRAYPLIEHLLVLSQKHNRRLMVRLVKGAYWDSEIKISQELGFESYPVFTRKQSTDVSYMACAKKLLAHPENFYPQFATHNAYTMASIIELAGSKTDFEFQRLHGMGESLHEQIIVNNSPYRTRVYAPVGGHKHLLAYLVRRLLENGANTSFVNRIIDQDEPIDNLIKNPIDELQEKQFLPNPGIPLPRDIYGATRFNANGIDFSCPLQCAQLQCAMMPFAEKTWAVTPILAEKEQATANDAEVVIEPATGAELGTVINASVEQCKTAVANAQQAYKAWDALGIKRRAKILRKAANLLEAQMPLYLALLSREAGKTLPNALAEIREAIDFCRYYAEQAETHLSEKELPGPTGEINKLSCHGRGAITCISPWNFPLAIFMGQVVAALVAGNTVLAKPAEQTPIVAFHAVKLLHEAGVPVAVCQFLPGIGEDIGPTLVAHPQTAGVMFTGSTEVAKIINQTLANKSGPIVPFIAETGGQNCMVVDSSALLEQVTTDVIASAFDSAGQRCSALRVLYVQEDIADDCIAMIRGAMQELNIGQPKYLETDVGPVIDSFAKQKLEQHIAQITQSGCLLAQAPDVPTTGWYVAPVMIEIDHIECLQEEVFGPVLHIIRFAAKQLEHVIEQINSTGFGLTFGVHSRIEHQADELLAKVNAGNGYINRNMVGAVVGVQPFGGMGLSGTGPKAGGPHYLSRLITEKTYTKNITAFGGNASLLSLG